MDSFVLYREFFSKGLRPLALSYARFFTLGSFMVKQSFVLLFALDKQTVLCYISAIIEATT